MRFDNPSSKTNEKSVQSQEFILHSPNKSLFSRFDARVNFYIFHYHNNKSGVYVCYSIKRKDKLK